ARRARAAGTRTVWGAGAWAGSGVEVKRGASFYTTRFAMLLPDACAGRRRGLERPGETLEPGVDVPAHVHARDPPATADEHVEITGRRRVAQRAEAWVLAGDRLVAALHRELQEHAGGRAAPVELPRGVEIARAVAERGGHVRRLPPGVAQAVERGVAGVGAFEE